MGIFVDSLIVNLDTRVTKALNGLEIFTATARIGSFVMQDDRRCDDCVYDIAVDGLLELCFGTCRQFGNRL